VKIHLRRLFDCEFGMFGMIEAGPTRLMTIERRWKENVARESCVPAGLYKLEPHSGTRFKDTWALVGAGVVHWPDTDPKTREAVLIHPANFAHQLEGCIAPGIGIEFFGDVLGVTNSVVAMARLRTVLRGQKPLELEITSPR
jgi:hypothetical protein